MVFGPRRAVNRSAEEERRTGFNKRFIDVVSLPSGPRVTYCTSAISTYISRFHNVAGYLVPGVFGPRRAVNRSAEEERRTGFNKRFIDEFYDSRMPWGQALAAITRSPQPGTGLELLSLTSEV
jgi:hypothetical protein